MYISLFFYFCRWTLCTFGRWRWAHWHFAHFGITWSRH